MLIRLAISKLATIDALTLNLEGGFTVLTGETGAGKSILIDAIRFVLGEKAAPEQVRSGARQTLVEAVFAVSSLPPVLERLEALSIPCQGELTLRRMLQENGRSRALANDCAITQARLEELGSYLVNIHGQHDNQMLLDPATHLDFLDAFGGLEPLRGQVAEAHGAYGELLRERKALREAAGQREARREALGELLAELREARLVPGEEEALRAEHTLLSHAEQLTGLLEGACEALYEGDQPILSRLGEVRGGLEQAAAVDPRLAGPLEQVAPLAIQLEDLYRTLRAHAAGLEADPLRLEGINARLAELEKIKRRHGPALETALRRLAEAEEELATLENAEENLGTLEARLAGVAAQLHALSAGLSRKRREAAARFDQAIAIQLGELGMERAGFETRIGPLAAPAGKTPSYAATGMDTVEFLLSTNPGQALRPLARIASGGELSRTMLALKTILAKADPTLTLIFDEVDAGISGRMAEIVGRKLRTLGGTHQVLCVTHLPQIAALGHQNVRVSKHAADGQTFTRVEPLDEKAKVEEVARLLSGLQVTSHSLASAEEMVNRGRNPGA